MMTTVINSMLFIIEELLISYFIIKSYQRDDSFGKTLGRIFTSSFVVTLSYGLTFAIHNHLIMSILHSIYFIGIDWVLYFIILYVDEYLDNKGNKPINNIFMIVLILDSISLGLNPITNLTMHYNVVLYRDFEILQYDPQFLYNVHLFIDYILVIYVLYNLIAAAVKAPRYYKMKPLTIFAIFLAIVAANAFFILLGSFVIDYSTLFYGLGAIAMYHSTYRYVPSKLLSSVKEVVDDQLLDATLIYNYNGDLMSSNAMARELFDEEQIATLDSFMDYVGNINGARNAEREIFGRYYEVSETVNKDDNDRLLATSFLIHDITDSKKSMEEVHHAATYDSLTGIYNKYGFMDEIVRLTPSEDCALLIVGISNFKGINSLYGSEFGDNVLTTIASELRKFYEDSNCIFGRTSEAKFAVVLQKSLIKDFEHRFSYVNVHLNENITIRVNLYFGYALFTGDNEDAEKIYNHATVASDYAKENFASEAIEYDGNLNRDLAYRQSLIMDLDDALTYGEIFFVLQPLIDMKTRKTVGAEALARWNHHKYGLISPVTFIPLFEENGFITKIDRYLWDKVCQVMKEWREENLFNGYFAINVSPIDAAHFDVVAYLNEICEKYDVDHQNLHVEITETAVAENENDFQDTLVALKKNGYVVEIDDFGSGYSFLNILADLSFDVVKLDMKFMMKAAASKKSEIVIPAICKMIHELGSEIVVEGVEDESQEELARLADCDVLQGYYYSKPLDLGKFRGYIIRNG